MPVRKPLPIKLGEEIPEVPVTVGIDSDSSREIDEMVPDALSAVREIINDEDHKDRYNASVLVLKQKGIVVDKRENIVGEEGVSENVLKLVKEIGSMFGVARDVTPKKRKVVATDAEVIDE